MSPRPTAPDQDQRDLAVHSRGVNVVVDAGAGTGKTTILVARLVALVAPLDDALPALELERVAAITFTRKAAGELKLRIRQALLAALAASGLTPVRRDRLSRALGALDTAWVGTIHSFADRLLRLHALEARIGPDLAIVEDEAALVHEALELLLQAAESGTVADELRGWCTPAEAAVATEAIEAALTAHLRVETQELGWGTRNGIEALFGAFIDSRDVAPTVLPPARANLTAFRRYADELAERVRPCKGDAPGTRWLRSLAEAVGKVRDEKDAAVIARELSYALRLPWGSKRASRKDEFGGDEAAWSAWKAFIGDTGKKADREGALRDDLCGPIHRWLAGRLVAARPAVLAAYAKVKARRRAVDQLDLLLLLRDLLRRDLAVRGRCQALFDHLFVDEFQDTDPLQAEIVLLLAEREPVAARWEDVAVAPGRLTLVGDPKQSIYRFRRADVAVYAGARAVVERSDCRVARLTANFRCLPGIVAFVNDRFDEVLGTVAAGAPVFDAEQGTVANERLLAGREGADARRVTLLPIPAADKVKVEKVRADEARALAAWIRRTVDEGRCEIEDPITRERRPARFGDVAVLATSTTSVALLLRELDRLGVPCAARGGRLFLEEPLHRRFLLALRAIADRDDGVGLAALLAPPFFALSLDDLLREAAASKDEAIPEDDGIRRVREARALVTELRRRRLERAPGSTARDLLERTGLGRTAALGPNGAQRLARLRELCLSLDAIAQAEGLDFDGATARLREWAIEPVQLDPPRPVSGDAVQFLTTFQAKGLEFPVVALWDGSGLWSGRPGGAPWVVDRDGASWTVELDGLSWEEPAETGLRERERRYRDAERKRLAYVAATRARDLLVVPVRAPGEAKYVHSTLTGAAPPELLDVLPEFDPAEPPEWGSAQPPPDPGLPGLATALAEELASEWAAALDAASRPLHAPASVSGEAHRALSVEEEEAGASPRVKRPSRHGPVFGDTVHRAIGIALQQPTLAPAAAVAQAAQVTGLDARLAEAAEDVSRALAALSAAGLRRAPGADLQLEYPLAHAADGKLLSGYVDLLAAAADGAIEVIDFKTDAPPQGDVRASHPDYVAQVRSYARILESLGVAGPGRVRSGLLFTADGGIRWV